MSKTKTWFDVHRLRLGLSVAAFAITAGGVASAAAQDTGDPSGLLIGFGGGISGLIIR